VSINYAARYFQKLLEEAFNLCYKSSAPLQIMLTSSNTCHECGVQLDLGLAICPHCGAKVGTLFSESTPYAARLQSRRSWSEQVSRYQLLEKARDNANNALILALASFFCPGLGFIMGAIAIYLGISSNRTLRAHSVEEGRGASMAGIAIGALAILAQLCYIIYLLRQGLPLLGL
jgi:uncharacterized Zn finger protein (UPF0148 family)